MLTIFIILLILSGFFSGAETALYSISKVEVKRLVRKKRNGAKALSRIKENPKRLLITILIGNNIANVAASILSTILAIQWFGSYGAGIAFGGTTFLILLFGEIFPKSLATAQASSIALITARPIELMSYILYPLVIVFEKLMKITGPIRPMRVTEEDIQTITAMGVEAGTIEEEEKEIIGKVFQFTDITAEDVMTPRSKIFSLNANLTVENVIKIIRKKPYSRIPVFKNTKDNIVGILYTKDLIKYRSETKKKTPIGEIAKDPYFIPDKKSLHDLLKEFQKRAVHLAVVVNEWGEIIGLITLEDILEELVGEISDEKDVDRIVIKRIDKNTILVDGATEVSAINKFLKIKMSGGEHETVGAIILDNLGRIPQKGEVLELDNLKINIEDATKKTVLKVKISK